MATNNSTVAWVENGTSLTKLTSAEFASETELEDRVFAEPALVEPGLIILARQITTDAGQLDLLGLDAEGRVVIVELKKAQTDRYTIAQALDYAACLSETSYSQLASLVDGSRKKWALEKTLDEILEGQANEDLDDWWRDQELRLVVVGRGEDPSLRRIVRYAAGRYELPINGVFLDLFRLNETTRVFVRTSVIGDADAQLAGKGKGRHHVDADAVRAIADEFGTRKWCEDIVKQWCESTDTTATTERKKDAMFYRLKAKNNRKKGLASVYPRDFDSAATSAAWIELSLDAFARDTAKTAAEVESLLASVGTLQGIRFTNPVFRGRSARRIVRG